MKNIMTINAVYATQGTVSACGFQWYSSAVYLSLGNDAVENMPVTWNSYMLTYQNGV